MKICIQMQKKESKKTNQSLKLKHFENVLLFFFLEVQPHNQYTKPNISLWCSDVCCVCAVSGLALELAQP